MDIKFNTATSQISGLYTAHFAKKIEETKQESTNYDKVILSQKQNDNHFDALADKIANKMSTVTKEDFMEQVKQLQNGNQLKINPHWEVDPDGSIARKTYFESYLGQLKETENTIKNYYSDAYEEAISAPINSLAFISGKYLCDWSNYFDSSMPEKQRQWTHSQLRAMLTDGHVALNDPYALAACGGPKTVQQMDEIAKQAVKEKLDMLLNDRIS